MICLAFDFEQQVHVPGGGWSYKYVKGILDISRREGPAQTAAAVLKRMPKPTCQTCLWLVNRKFLLDVFSKDPTSFGTLVCQCLIHQTGDANLELDTQFPLPCTRISFYCREFQELSNRSLTSREHTFLFRTKREPLT